MSNATSPEPTLQDSLIDLAARGGQPRKGEFQRVPWDDLWAAAGSLTPEEDPHGGKLCSWWKSEGRRDSAASRLHMEDQASLLRDAASILVEAVAPEGNWLGACFMGEAAPRREPWRGRARLTMASPRGVGLEGPRALVVSALWAPEVIDARGLRAVARAAVGLEPGPAALLALARARVACGAADAAIHALDRARHELGESGNDDRIAERIERCRIVALELRGDLHAALAGICALRSSDRAVIQLGLALAFAVGRRDLVETFVGQLGETPADPSIIALLAPRTRLWQVDANARIDRGAVRVLGLADPALAATRIARLFA